MSIGPLAHNVISLLNNERISNRDEYLIIYAYFYGNYLLRPIIIRKFARKIGISF